MTIYLYSYSYINTNRNPVKNDNKRGYPAKFPQFVPLRDHYYNNNIKANGFYESYFRRTFCNVKLFDPEKPESIADSTLKKQKTAFSQLLAVKKF